jgi:hypothetical protein
MRNIKNGVKLTDAFYYKFLYSKLKSTKQEIVGKINYLNNTTFMRNSYEN